MAFICFGDIFILRVQYAMYYDAREPDYLGLQVVPSYEYGELVLKNYKENLSQTRPTVFIPGGSPDISEVLLSKDVVYSEV